MPKVIVVVDTSPLLTWPAVQAVIGELPELEQAVDFQVRRPSPLPMASRRPLADAAANFLGL